jgi:hypothetical protein
MSTGVINQIRQLPRAKVVTDLQGKKLKVRISRTSWIFGTAHELVPELSAR